MTVREIYAQRLGFRNTTSRDRWLSNTQSWIRKKLPRSLSYHTATIDGEQRQCAILSTQDTHLKKICSMPGEYLTCGTYVHWMGEVWLITDLNAPNEVYQTATMRQCNYVLKWVNKNGKVIARDVYVADGTKYLTGEYEQQFMTAGDARMQVTMPRDSETVLIDRGRRFIIDDSDAGEAQVFEVTKVNRVGNVYNKHGVFIHMLCETPRNDKTDNYDLMVANYYDRISDISIIFENVSNQIFISLGSTVSINASVYDGGSRVDSARIEYSSSDPSIATVGSDGVVTPVSIGVCEITASYNDATSTVSLIVEEQQEDQDAHISLGNIDSMDGISVGSEIHFSCSLFVGGRVVTGSDISVSISCDSGIATLVSDADGYTISADKNRANIGKKVIIRAVCEQYAVSAEKTLKVKGWS